MAELRRERSNLEGLPYQLVQECTQAAASGSTVHNVERCNDGHASRHKMELLGIRIVRAHCNRDDEARVVKQGPPAVVDVAGRVGSSNRFNEAIEGFKIHAGLRIPQPLEFGTLHVVGIFWIKSGGKMPPDGSKSKFAVFFHYGWDSLV